MKAFPAVLLLATFGASDGQLVPTNRSAAFGCYHSGIHAVTTPLGHSAATVSIGHRAVASNGSFEDPGAVSSFVIAKNAVRAAGGPGTHCSSEKTFPLEWMSSGPGLSPATGLARWPLDVGWTAIGMLYAMLCSTNKCSQGWTGVFVLVALVHGAQAPCPAGQYGDWDDGQSGASCNPATYKFQETDARRRSPSAYENAETTCKTACRALSDCVAISLQNSTVWAGRRRGRRRGYESAKTCHTCTRAPTPAPTNPTRRRRYNYGYGGDCRRRYCGYGYGGTVDTRRRGYIVYTHPPCTACASGRSSSANSGSASQCTECAAGKYTGAGGLCVDGLCWTGLCTDCGTGQYSSSGSTWCTLCPEGRSSGATAATSGATCVACVAGKYAGTGRPWCTDCSAGQFSKTAAAACYSALECPVGYYCEGASGATQPCTAGTASAVVGLKLSSGCIVCQAGRYSGTAATVCSICTPGKYSLAQAAQPTNCPAGRASAVVAAASSAVCKICEAGKYAATGSSVCTSCEPGKYSLVEAGAPTMCPPGTFSAAVGANSSATCAVCQPGRYCIVGSPAGALCAAGTSSASAGAVSNATCQSCIAGYFSGSGAPNCTGCPSGKISTAVAATSIATCGDCSAGRFAASIGSTACAPCSPDAFSTTGSCVVVHPYCVTSSGFPNPYQVSETCTITITEAGTISVIAFDTEPVLDYLSIGGLAYSGTSGPAGVRVAAGDQATWSTDTSGNENGIKICNDQNLHSATGASSCVFGCNAGYLCPGHTSEMIPCPVGQFSTESNSTTCQACAPGFFSTGQGLTFCRTCLPGRYAHAGAHKCESCSPGWFSAKAGAGVCKVCPAGKENGADVTDATTCRTCLPGRYAHAGAHKCDLCPEDTFGEGSGRISCHECGVLHYAEPGSSDCYAGAGLYILIMIVLAFAILGSLFARQMAILKNDDNRREFIAVLDNHVKKRALMVEDSPTYMEDLRKILQRHIKPDIFLPSELGAESLKRIDLMVDEYELVIEAYYDPEGITVQLENDTDETRDLRITPSVPIGRLKKLIYGACSAKWYPNTGPEGLKLLFGGMELQDHETCKENDVCEGAVIQVRMRNTDDGRAAETVHNNEAWQPVQQMPGVEMQNLGNFDGAEQAGIPGQAY